MKSILSIAKSSVVLLMATLTFVACQPALNVPEDSVDNQKLNSLITLEDGENVLYLQDFILDVINIDSVTTRSAGVTIRVSEDKQIVKLFVLPEMPAFIDVKVWMRGNAYSIPCRRSDKLNFMFTFHPQGKMYEEVRIAGQMNDWTPSATPALNLNNAGVYEVMLRLSPGTYLYQLSLDGEQDYDPSNPEKVDNGYGKHNSILKVEGVSDLYPQLITRSSDYNKVRMSYKQRLDEVFVYWQNHRLPQHFIRVNDGEIAFDIPAEANAMERSYIRVWASNEFGVSNDVLIPLQKGKVVTDARLLKRSDRHTQLMYFVLVDRFYNGNLQNDSPLNRPDVHPKVDFHGGDLAGLQQKIDDGYFERLGINTLWISPLSQNPEGPYGYYAPKDTKFSGYHGYWPVSSSKVDRRFGTNAEFKTLVERAQRKGMNVLLDYVANHVHELHPLYQRHPEYATSLYLPDGTMNVEKWDEQRLTTWFDTFMPTLDFSQADVVELMTDSALYWLKEFNLDGFRHDACKHIDENFWRALTLKIKRQLPGKHPYQVGETYGSPSLIASYLTSGMLDGQFDFNLYDIANAVFAGIGGDLTRVREVMCASLATYGTHHLMGNISGNHDKARFMAYASGDLLLGEDAKDAGWMRDIGISDSTAYDKFSLMHTFNLTIPGVPVLYYGDEIGMTGANDPDSRRMMRFDGWNPREQKLWNHVSTLSHLRRSSTVLMYGSFISLKNTSTGWVYARKYFDREAIVFLNNSAKSKKMEVTLPEYFDQTDFQSVFGNKFQKVNHQIVIELPPFSSEVLI